MKHAILGAACAGILIAASDAVQAVAVSGQGTWESTLQGRDLDGNLATFEAYYDTTWNITWLADANYARSSGYHTSGSMDWFTANEWAVNLNPYSSGITGWRLPVTIDVGNNGATYPDGDLVPGWYQGVDFGYNISTYSEMSHMYYVTLGNMAMYTTDGSDQAGGGLINTGPFANIQQYAYWSGTEYAPITSIAWDFQFGYGNQGYYYKSNVFYGWAVHDGDVGVAASMYKSRISPTPGISVHSLSRIGDSCLL